MLDEHLCVVYANVARRICSQWALTNPAGIRSRNCSRIPNALRAAAASLARAYEACAGHEIELMASAQAQRDPTVLDITVTPLEGQVTGTHLLLELVDARVRQRIARESEMLSRLDGSRLMISQLAHEIKNPLGGLRGAAQLLDRELHDGALKEYTAVIINEADRLRALVDSMLAPARAPQMER